MCSKYNKHVLSICVHVLAVRDRDIFVCNAMLFHVCVWCYRQIALYTGDKGQCSRLSTGGVDGQLVIWDLKVTSLD